MRTDLHLTLAGKQQALELANHFHFHQISPQAIYAGTLKRQIETAEILSQNFHLSQIYLGETALTEIDYGLWEGLPHEIIQMRWKREYEAWALEGKWPTNVFGGSLEEHLKNIQEWLQTLRTRYRAGDTVMAIGSQGILRLFHPKRHQLEDLKVKTGHFCELELHPDSLFVKSWNQKPSSFS